MRSAVRARVVQNAEFHRNLSIYYREQGGIAEPQPESEVKTESDSTSEDSSINEDGSRRRSSRVTAVRSISAEDQPELVGKSQEQVIAEMHANAAQQLEDLARDAPGALPTAAQERANLPENLRRTNTVIPRARRTVAGMPGATPSPVGTPGITPVRSGGPAR